MKKKNIFILIVVLLVPIIVFYILNDLFDSGIDSSAQTSFWGGYLGGIVTLLGVLVTIDNSRKEKIEDNARMMIKEKNEKKRAIKPYLYTEYKFFESDFSFNDNDRYYETDGEKIEKCHLKPLKWEMDRLKDFKNRSYIPIRYIIRNVGAASAIDVIVSVNGFLDKMAIAKDDTINLLLMIKNSSTKEVVFDIKIDYSDCEDLGHYSTEEKICIFIDEFAVKTLEKRTPYEV